MSEKIEVIEVSIAAKRLKVSDRTIYRYLQDDTHPLQGIRISTYTWRVLKSSLDDLLGGNFAKVSRLI